MARVAFKTPKRFYKTLRRGGASLAPAAHFRLEAAADRFGAAFFQQHARTTARPAASGFLGAVRGLPRPPAEDQRIPPAPLQAETWRLWMGRTAGRSASLDVRAYEAGRHCRRADKVSGPDKIGRAA